MRRGLGAVSRSITLQFLLVAVLFLAYNHQCYLRRWVTSRPPPYFGDTVAPFYAQMEDWVRMALRGTPAQRLTFRGASRGITQLTLTLDGQALQRIGTGLWQRLPRLLTSLIIFAAVLGLAIQQLNSKRPLRAWVVCLSAPVLVFCMNISVAMIDDGFASVTQPFARQRLEYYWDVPAVNDQPAEFIRNYPKSVRPGRWWWQSQSLSHHARTHPPGPVLFLWAVGKLFDPSIRTAALAAIAISSLGVVPAYLFARDRYGERVALIALALYLLTPSLVLFGATSMDGVFAVLPIASLWLMHRAIMPAARNEPPPAWWPQLRAVIWSILGGVALAGATFMTWASVCVCIVLVVLLLMQGALSRPWFVRSLLLLTISASTFVLIYLLLYVTLRYDPIACLRASIQVDAQVVDQIRRHHLDVGFANLIAFLAGAGLITTTLWLRQVARASADLIHQRSERLMEVAMFVAVVLLSFSRLFTLETERIWLFLLPPIIAAAAAEICAASSLGLRRATLCGVMILLMAQTWAMELFLNTWW